MKMLSQPLTQPLKSYYARLLSVSFDMGPPDATTLLAGMGRSGTTWVMDIMNHKNDYRTIFEPFLPSEVPEAFCFKIHHYIRPNTVDPLLERQARLILGGGVKNKWVDIGKKRKLVYHKRIVKDIRCNLMLPWLKSLIPDMPIILLVRHPLAIAYSWEKLSTMPEDPMWNDRRDFQLILSQNTLLNDYQIIRQAANEINTSSIMETILFIWCVLYYVPIKQLKQGDVYITTYEDLVLNPEKAFTGLFNHLGVEMDWSEIHFLFDKPSITNFLKRDFKEMEKVLLGWKSRYSKEELKRANHILRLFDLQDIYGQDGLPSKDLQGILYS
jgi:hypothetical protein